VGLISELKRRNVFRMAVLYVVAAWLVMQVAEVIIGLADLPGWTGPAVLAVLAVGFPIALIVSWLFEITPEGIARDEDVVRGGSLARFGGRRLDFIVISLLCAAVLLFAYDKWWVPAPPEKSIAVLPFVNMSGDPEQEYFSDGLSEELLNLLSQLPGMSVPARTSSFYFKGKNVQVAEIAAQLNVSHLLEGSVRRAGDRVRITAQLINAADGYHVWSRTFDRDVGDILAVQDEIAAAISDALEIRLTAGSDAIPQLQTHALNTEAYDAYLKGRELTHLRASPYIDQAIDELERSLRLDANFAPAHAQLAFAVLLQVQSGRVTASEALREALPHLQRAQELEPDLAELQAGRALYAGIEGNLEDEIRFAQRALAINPSYSDALNILQVAYEKLGHYRESDEVLSQLVAVDPFNVIGRWNYAERLNLNGRHEEAHEIAEAIMGQSEFWGCAVHGETALLYEGRIAEGLSWVLKAARAIDRGTPAIKVAFGMVDEFDEARRVVEVPNYWIDAYADGKWDEALRQVDELVAEKPGYMSEAAELYYDAGRFDDALPYYEQLLGSVPVGRPVPAFRPVVQTVRLAFMRRRAGDLIGAQAAMQIARNDHVAQREAGRRGQYQDVAAAVIAAFERDDALAIESLQAAVAHGLRDSGVFDDPLFDNIKDNPQFIAVRTSLAEILDIEHDKVLQLICFNNPVPDYWQPLPETCSGVEDQSRP